MNSPAITISDLSHAYEKMTVLQGVNLEIAQGEFLGIIGPNGGGKTTLLRLIMGLLPIQRGKITLFGKEPALMRHRIGYVPQVNSIDRDFPITVLELVMLGALTHRFSYPPHTKEKALELLDTFKLSPHASKAFSSLSGGLAQKALLARALLSDPDLLILDEPTANVDPASRIAIAEELENIRGEKTILLVTHDLHIIIERVDRILCVQTQANTYLPDAVCEHFALGLYHTPMLLNRNRNEIPLSL